MAILEGLDVIPAPAVTAEMAAAGITTLVDVLGKTVDPQDAETAMYYTTQLSKGTDGDDF